MPLSAVNFVPTTGNIKAADMLAFFNLFTGVMTDQPVTFANTLSVGGSQGASSVPLKISGVVGQTASMLEARAASGDAQPVFLVGRTGSVQWGIGGANAPDVTLARSAVGALTVTGSLTTVGRTTDNTAFSLITQNSSAQSLTFVRNDGYTQITKGGLGVVAGNAAIGGAPDPAIALWVTSGVSGLNAYGIRYGGVLTATGDNALLAAISLEPNVNPNGHAGIFEAGVSIAAWNAAGSSNSASILINPVTGGATQYGIFINAPTGGSASNVGLWITAPTGSGLTQSLHAQGDVGIDGSALLGGAAKLIGFYGSAGILKQTVTGSKGGNAALTSILSVLNSIGLITDSST